MTFELMSFNPHIIKCEAVHLDCEAVHLECEAALDRGVRPANGCHAPGRSPPSVPRPRASGAPRCTFINGMSTRNIQSVSEAHGVRKLFKDLFIEIFS